MIAGSTPRDHSLPIPSVPTDQVINKLSSYHRNEAHASPLPRLLEEEDQHEHEEDDHVHHVADEVDVEEADRPGIIGGNEGGRFRNGLFCGCPDK